MNSENFEVSERLVNAAYVRQGSQGRRAHELRFRMLLEQVKTEFGEVFQQSEWGREEAERPVESRSPRISGHAPEVSRAQS